MNVNTMNISIADAEVTCKYCGKTHEVEPNTTYSVWKLLSMGWEIHYGIIPHPEKKGLGMNVIYPVCYDCLESGTER